MKSQTRHFFYALLSAMVVAVMIAAPAHAQSPADEAEPSTQQFELVEDSAGQIPSPIVQAPPPQIRSPYWSANAGFEADSHDTGYGFVGPTYVKPFRPKMAFVASGSVNYLYYEYPTFPEGAGHTNVRSPGVSVKGGVRFGDRNYFQLTAGPGFKRRYIEDVDPFGNVIRRSRNIKVGLNLGADLWVNPTRHNNIFGMVNYGAEDGYIWSRLAYKEQITNRDWSGDFAHFLGAEVIGQGNQDIRSTQVGAFFEVAHAPSSVSVMVRGGFKRSVYDFGPDKTGPWFAIGFWHRLR